VKHANPPPPTTQRLSREAPLAGVEMAIHDPAKMPPGQPWQQCGEYFSWAPALSK
jgi:hypothetical protein